MFQFKCNIPVCKYLLVIILMTSAIAGMSQPGGDFSNLRIHQSFNMITDPPGYSNYPFRINDLGIDGGRFFVAVDGNIGIGNPNPGGNPLYPQPEAKLDVSGSSIIRGNTLISSDKGLVTRWVRTNLNGDQYWGLWLDKGVVATDYALTTTANWADYVFDEKYRLRPLFEVEKFIKLNKHLPDMPSEQKIKKDGYTLHDMNTRFMQKIEELTLYTIEQDKQINLLKKQLDELWAQIKLLSNKPSK